MFFNRLNPILLLKKADGFINILLTILIITIASCGYNSNNFLVKRRCKQANVVLVIQELSAFRSNRNRSISWRFLFFVSIFILGCIISKFYPKERFKRCCGDQLYRAIIHLLLQGFNHFSIYVFHLFSPVDVHPVSSARHRAEHMKKGRTFPSPCTHRKPWSDLKRMHRNEQGAPEGRTTRIHAVRFA